MQKYSFLGHDNASLSMLFESLYQVYQKDFSAEIITIMENAQIENQRIRYDIDGVESFVKHHVEWLPQANSLLVLGTMIAKIKIKIYEFFKENYAIEHVNYSNIIHPNAIQSETSKIGSGTSLGPGSILAPYSKLGNQVSVNRNATVGHHTTLSDFVTLNPGCNIAGFCQIDEGVTIGMGANIIDGRRVGKNSIIGAGSLVTKDIPENVVAYGSPAKVVRSKK